jgi:hypothetical protein
VSFRIVFLVFFACSLTPFGVLGESLNDEGLISEALSRAKSQIQDHSEESRAYEIRMKTSNDSSPDFATIEPLYPQSKTEKYLRPLWTRLEWFERGFNKGNEIADADLKKIGNSLLLDSYLNLKLQKFKALVFGLKLPELVLFRKQMRLLISSLNRELVFKTPRVYWWKWFLLSDAEASKQSFSGFSPDLENDYQAISEYFSRFFNGTGEISLRDYYDVRYILNSSGESSELLKQFDNLTSQSVFELLRSKNSKKWNEIYRPIQESQWIPHRIQLSREVLNLALLNNDAYVAEKILSLILQDRSTLGFTANLSDFEKLLDLRLELGKGEESLLVLENIRILKSQDHEWHFKKGKALELLAKNQIEPDRSNTLAWAQENYRLALNNRGMMSVDRDELMLHYARVLEKRGFLGDAGDVFEKLFKGGLERSARLSGLKNWIDNLLKQCELKILSQNSTAKTEAEALLRQSISLAGFYANTGEFDEDLRSIVARMRMNRRKLKLDQDAPLSASVFEIESRMIRSKRAKN